MVSQSDADTSSHTSGRMSSVKARVQIVGCVSGRRNWTVEQKLAIIGEAFTSGSSVAGTIERHEISSGQLYTWRRQLLDGELGGVRNGNLDQQNGLGFARVELAPPCETPALPPFLTMTSSSSSPGACERSHDRCGVIEIELRSGVRVRVHEGVDGALLTSVLDALGAR
jgi:transposase